MPMTRHRLTLATVLVAILAAFAAAAAPGRAGADSSHPIVERALRDLGTHQGECWPWVKRVVFDATGREMGFDYRDGFFEAGAVEVSLEEAAPGDVIQIALDAWTSPDADYPGLHTAIVIRNNGDGTFDAIDSNQLWDGVVRLRPAYNPAAQAAAYGLQVHVYRFTAAAAAPPSAAPAPGPLVKGDTARTNTPGDCLRLRSAPGGDIIDCLGHGSRVTILEGPVEHLGMPWYRVATARGEGWMAGPYLLKEPGPGANPSAQGPTRPILQYRAIIPLTASD
ncbi:hypothetical protein [Tepidiforma sp.]|uniref:hypothetical protein n=1 Tax=Tepidiforma sp. TaxID=2682230 RepID=UPI002ADD807D|nr:hypothetical protein [Tepidiforma sp.]